MNAGQLARMKEAEAKARHLDFKTEHMKLSDIKSLDFKGVVSVVSLVGSLGAMAFAKLGKQEAAAALQQCSDSVNSLGLGTIEVCKEAAKETVSASKEIVAGALAGLSTLFGILSKPKYK